MRRSIGCLILLLKLPIDILFIALPFLIVFAWTDLSPLWLIVLCPLIIGPGLTFVQAIEGFILKNTLTEELETMEKGNTKELSGEKKEDEIPVNDLPTEKSISEAPSEPNIFSTEEFYKLFTDKRTEEYSDLIKERESYLKFCKLPDDLRDYHDYDTWADDPVLRAYCISMVFGFICCGPEATDEAENEGFIIYMSIVPVIVKKISDNYKGISKNLFYGAIFKAYSAIRYYSKSSARESYSTYLWIVSWFRVRTYEQNTLMNALNSLLDFFLDQKALESKFDVSLSDYNGIRKRFRFVIDAVLGEKDDLIFPSK